MVFGNCGMRNAELGTGKIAKLQKLLNWEYEISPIPQFAFRNEIRSLESR